MSLNDSRKNLGSVLEIFHFVCLELCLAVAVVGAQLAILVCQHLSEQ